MSQALGSLFYVHYVFDRFCIPQFKDFNEADARLKTIILAIFGSIIPGALVLVLLFWCLLHCWMNAFAEMTRFGDRLFYKDWWNSTSFSGYYRMWNLIIHDWCYAYIYRDMASLLPRHRRGLAALFVFLMSSIIHEYVLLCAFRLFFPVLFILYAIFGVTFFFISRAIRGDSAWNVAMFFNLMIGNGMIIAFYSMEWYARKNCATTHEGLWDLLIPRISSCKFHS